MKVAKLTYSHRFSCRDNYCHKDLRVYYVDVPSGGTQTEREAFGLKMADAIRERNITANVRLSRFYNGQLLFVERH